MCRRYKVCSVQQNCLNTSQRFLSAVKTNKHIKQLVSNVKDVIYFQLKIGEVQEILMKTARVIRFILNKIFVNKRSINERND